MITSVTIHEVHLGEKWLGLNKNCLMGKTRSLQRSNIDIAQLNVAVIVTIVIIYYISLLLIIYYLLV